jgi:REP element-mobilizing transposase RayT
MMIEPDLRERLYPFMGGIVRDRGASLIAIGGMPDHVHMLVRMGPENSTAEIMRHTKSRSS